MLYCCVLKRNVALITPSLSPIFNTTEQIPSFTGTVHVEVVEKPKGGNKEKKEKKIRRNRERR